ncbi:MAG: histone deacetylase family protein [Acidimicrobiales bacterium]
MAVLFVTHPRYFDHDTGSGHPERPQRLTAVLEGAEQAGLGDELVWTEPRPAGDDDLERVHSRAYVEAVARFCASGGGWLDDDTIARPESYQAARLAAGAGLTAVDRLDAGEASAAFCAIRPPGHHAEPTQAMGFCLFNNVAVTAAALAGRGERVLIVDYDAHHGNGTQDTFIADPRVMYVSMHQFPLFPGTGRLDDVGTGPATGSTVNFPFPAGTTGDAFLAAVDEVVAPLSERWKPTWLLISAGFDAHRADPLTGLGLSAGDYADLTLRLLELVPPPRRVAFLEGGYDLDALAASTSSCLAALAGSRLVPEPVTAGGPGRTVVGARKLVQDRLDALG